MFYFLLLVVSLLSSTSLAASTCSKPLPTGQSPGQTSNVTIQSNGITRWYLITIPPRYTTSSSVPVISFHGGTRTADEQLALSQTSNPEFNDFALAVYPQGIDKTWEGIPSSTANDTLFVQDIIPSLKEQYCISVSQIWATGKSDGGGFCNTLACDPILSTQIAAFAPVSGAYYIEIGDASSLIVEIFKGQALG